MSKKFFLLVAWSLLWSVVLWWWAFANYENYSINNFEKKLEKYSLKNYISNKLLHKWYIVWLKYDINSYLKVNKWLISSSKYLKEYENNSLFNSWIKIQGYLKTAYYIKQNWDIKNNDYQSIFLWHIKWKINVEDKDYKFLVKNLQMITKQDKKNWNGSIKIKANKV